MGGKHNELTPTPRPSQTRGPRRWPVRRSDLEVSCPLRPRTSGRDTVGLKPNERDRHEEIHRAPRLVNAQQCFRKHDRHGEVAVAVVIEEDGHLVSVVALDRALSPPLAADARTDPEWRLGLYARGTLTVVVTGSAWTFVVLPEVAQQERAPASRVFGVAAHHLEPGGLDLVLAGRRVRGCLA